MGQVWEHKPVLVDEVVRWLSNTARGGYGARVFVDGTLGDGGHSEAILEASAPDGVVIGVDVDDDAIRSAQDRLRRFGERFRVVRGNFNRLEALLSALPLFSGRAPQADGILFDLGVSTRQLLDPSRGFSLRSEGPLDMRMDSRIPDSARDVVESKSEEELGRIFWELGEERRSRRVARAIVERRDRRPIVTTRDLKECVESAMGPKRGKIHPATRVFMALRIYVNDELGALENGLREGLKCLARGGRFLVLSYHSLEDRAVKGAFRESNRADPERYRHLSKKPLVASIEERRLNPRARSAKLRGLEVRG